MVRYVLVVLQDLFCSEPSAAKEKKTSAEADTEGTAQDTAQPNTDGMECLWFFMSLTHLLESGSFCMYGTACIL